MQDQYQLERSSHLSLLLSFLSQLKIVVSGKLPSEAHLALCVIIARALHMSGNNTFN